MSHQRVSTNCKIIYVGWQRIMWATLHEVYNVAFFHYIALWSINMVGDKPTFIISISLFLKKELAIRPHNSHSVRLFRSRFENSNKLSLVGLVTMEFLGSWIYSSKWNSWITYKDSIWDGHTQNQHKPILCIPVHTSRAQRCLTKGHSVGFRSNIGFE